MTRIVQFAFTIALGILVLLAPRADAADSFQMISADEVQALLGKPGVHVFDANSPERFQQGHLPGATHVTKDNVVARLPANKDATLVFYCTNPK